MASYAITEVEFFTRPPLVLTLRVPLRPDLKAAGFEPFSAPKLREGMLFDSPDGPTGLIEMWIAKVQFPLSILWLRDGEVIHIEHNVQPGDLAVFKRVADWVVEMSPEAVKRFGVDVGTEYELALDDVVQRVS